MAGTTSKLEASTRQVIREGKKWIVPMARAGYASKGAVYLMVGMLAFMAAFGLGGSISGPREALQGLQPKTFGAVLLGLIAVGLCCYGIWRFVQSIYDPDNRGRDARGLAIRIGAAVSGMVHLVLAWSAAQLALRKGGSAGGPTEDGLTAKLMAQPFGVWLVALVGVIIAIVAVYQIYRGVSSTFKKRVTLSGTSQKFRELLWRTCQFGLVARGITFGIVAWFFIRAALKYDPEQAGGLAQALGAVASQPYGPWLLGIMGLGLAAYGVFALVEARFRRISI